MTLSFIHYTSAALMHALATVILAAGKGTRMRSALPKVLHPVAGEPMLFAPVRLAKQLKSTKTVCILGHGQAQVEAALSAEPAFKSLPLKIVEQREPKGTAHAVKQCATALAKHQGDVLILCGDVPLLRKQSLQDFLKAHRRQQRSLTVMTTNVDRPRGYGRIIRDQQGKVCQIIEQLDATPAEQTIREINTGIYLVKRDLLFKALDSIKKNPKKQEYYLTDIVAWFAAQESWVGSYCLDDFTEVAGVNSRVDLARVNQWAYQQINEAWMEQGVSFMDPNSTYVDRSVVLAPDVSIGAACVLRGATKVKPGALIDVGCVLTDAVIDQDVHIKAYSVIESSRVKQAALIGPFAHIRPGSEVGPAAKVGNFVELKKTRLAKGAKANHLSYLGDAVIGEAANIGAGTITCNYDGIHKFKTQIGPRSFIGSDTQLVAPVTLGADAWVGAGTTVTKNVPAGALAVSRPEQMNIKGWTKRWVKRKK